MTVEEPNPALFCSHVCLFAPALFKTGLPDLREVGALFVDVTECVLQPVLQHEALPVDISLHTRAHTRIRVSPNRAVPSPRLLSPPSPPCIPSAG